MKTVDAGMSIDKINIYHFVQPIINLTNNKVYGYEFLLRSKEFKNPEVLFNYAIKENSLFQLDQKSIFSAFKSIENELDKLQDLYFFINIFPSTLIDENFYNSLQKVLSEIKIKPDSIVLEINESERGIDFSALKKAVERFKSCGFKISLDDIGKGEATIRAILEIEPSIAKIDRYFSKDLLSFPKKQEAIRYLIEFLGKGTELVLEGIETEADLEIAKKLGVPLAQGFHLGRPKPLVHFIK